jgi:hypothetical protein
LDKSKKGYIDSLKRSTDSQFYFNLTAYIKVRLEEIKTSAIKETDMDNVKRQQGRAAEMEEFLKSLTRRAVVNEHDGAYGN